MIAGLLNQKGGVGKTTLSVNLAASFALDGSRVLLIDADPQGSALDWAAARGEAKPLFPVVGIPRPSLHRDMDEIARGYDHVLIDAPPRATELAKSILAVADVVLIPVQPSPYDIWAAAEIVSLIEEVRVFRESLKYAFVINRKISNTAIGRDVQEALQEGSHPCLDAVVSQRVVFAETAASGLAVHERGASAASAAGEIENLRTALEEYHHA